MVNSLTSQLARSDDVVCVCVCVCVNHVALLAQLQSDLIVTVTSWRDDFAFSELATWPASDTLTRDIE